MQFRDLNRQYAAMTAEMDAAIKAVLQRADFIGGTEVWALEQRLAAYVGARHCITCANGTDALSLALEAMGIGPGDAVFVPDFTFFASGETVARAGAVPIFVDVEAETFNLSPVALEAAIKRVLAQGALQPRVIMPVDLFGLPARYDKLLPLARQYGLMVLEDGAQGFGGILNGQRVCSFGDVSITSFFPAKPLGCYGDGGAVFTDSDEMATTVRSLAVHGKGQNKYDNVRVGVNSRLDTLQAAVLLVKMDYFDLELKAVQEVADWYGATLSGAFEIPVVPVGFSSSWAQYTLRLHNGSQRDAIIAAMKAEGVPSMVYYPTAMHRQTAFTGASSSRADCPVTERLCETVLSLPMHPYLTEAELERVAETVGRHLNG